MKFEETPTEHLYVDHCNPEYLLNLIDMHHKVILQMKPTSTSYVFYINNH